MQRTKEHKILQIEIGGNPLIHSMPVLVDHDRAVVTVPDTVFCGLEIGDDWIFSKKSVTCLDCLVQSIESPNELLEQKSLNDSKSPATV